MAFPQLSNIDKRIYNTINSKTNITASNTMPWIRVISCLKDYLEIQSSKENESFAQRYGSTGRSGRIGVEYETPTTPKSVYSGQNDRGLRPSPTIDSISISQGNEGLSKKSSFTITCYTIAQCERIMEYFLEPGNHILVEWGENSRLSIKQKTPVERCAIAKYNNLNHIQKKRKASKGTYDAVLGVVTGGNMSYGSNETYEVSVELTAVGEIPAYLQNHKGGTTDGKVEKSSDKFDEESDEFEDATVGQKLFMQMYNDLPAAKRTDEVKKLYTTQPWSADAINFINMDKETREHLVEQLKGGGTLFKKGDQASAIEIKSDVPMFSEKRYIRAALAFTILDMDGKSSLIPQNSLCPGQIVNDPAIHWQNTICRGFKNMFSADSDYLYIPNKHSPNFDLAGALGTSKEQINESLPDLSKSNKIPVTGTSPQSYVYHLQDADAGGLKQTDDIHPKDYDPNAKKTSYFPNNKPLNSADAASYDPSYKPITALAGDWGFLRDLYINFDFFCDTIQKNGLVAKDVYYDLLNGMTSATNLYWNFQILMRGWSPTYSPGGETDDDLFYKYRKANDIEPSQCGTEHLEIVDLSMGGIMKKSTGVGLASFQSRGTRSPFLTAGLDFDIPGAMKSQVIARKLKNKNKNGNAESKEIVFDGLFSNEVDKVSAVLNDVNEQIQADNVEAARVEAQEELDADNAKYYGVKGTMKGMWNWGTSLFSSEETPSEKQSKANYEFFVGSANIVPWLQDREDKRDISSNWSADGKNASISEVAKVGGWDDPTQLKKIQRLNEGTLVKNSPGNNGVSNVPLLPIRFSFTIHGVSGIRVGDTFSISDLPAKYKNKTFQVSNVAHEIAQNLWSTKIEGQMRNLEVGEGVGNPQEYN